jgi:hypothetical protein
MIRTVAQYKAAYARKYRKAPEWDDERIAAFIASQWPLDPQPDGPTILVDDGNTVVGRELPMGEPEPAPRLPTGSTLAGHREDEPEPEYVPVDAPASPAAGQWWTGPRPRARTMAEAQEWLAASVEPEPDGAPTYSRTAETSES